MLSVRLGTKLIRLAKDCSSMKDLTTVGPQPENSTRDMKMKIVERLQEIVWTIQMDTGGLRQRLLLKQHFIDT